MKVLNASLAALFYAAAPMIFATTVVLSAPAKADEPAIRETMKSYIDAFNGHDAAAVAKLWTEKCIHIDRQTGAKTEGREAVARDLSVVFEATPDARLTGEVTSIRMIRPEVASVDGETMMSGGGVPASRSSFTAILVKEADGWRLDSVDETPIETTTDSVKALSELSWLIGKWRDESETAVVETNCNWSPNNAFLVRSYSVALGDAVESQGTQVIAWDAHRQTIRSWNFDTSGGFGEGTWTKVGNEWLVRSSQTSPEGTLSSGTYVITQVDQDTMTVQLIGQESNGELLPNEEPIRVVRVSDVTTEAAQSDAATIVEPK